MRIEEEIKRRTGIRLEDLAKVDEFKHDVNFARMADRVVRIQDGMKPLITAAQRFEKTAVDSDWTRFATCWNFLIRAMHQSLGVLSLMRDENIMDAAVLNRSILERGLLLEWLRETDGFDLFRKFTRVQEHRHKEMWMRHYPGQGKGMISAKDRAEIKEYKRELDAVEWRRPRMEDVAKRMGVGKMYDGIYDYSSGYVHPLFGEGIELFQAKIGKPTEGFVEAKSIILGQSASALALLCVTTSATLGRPKLAALRLMQCISEISLGKADPSADAILAKSLDLKSSDLFDPWTSTTDSNS